MNPPDLSENIFLILTLVVPGYLIAQVRAQFLTGRSHTIGEQIICFVALGALNYIIFWKLISYLTSPDSIDLSYTIRALLWATIIFIVPAVVGAVSGLLSQKDFFYTVLCRLGLSPSHPMPSAWDYYFLKKKDCFVLVSLKNGETVAGYFGLSSFASSCPDERDIYLQQTYRIDDQNQWHMDAPGKSILIAASDISSIQFWPT